MLRRRRGEFRGVWERGWEFGNKFGGLGTSLGVWGEDAIACNIYAVNFDFKNKFGKKITKWPRDFVGPLCHLPSCP